MAKRWTKKEERALIMGIGTYGIEWFRKHCGDSYDWPGAPKGRSAKACYNKALRIIGRGGLTQGSYSMNDMCLRSGYSPTQIRRAMKVLSQKWKRLSPGGEYIVYEDQYLDIVAWLSHDFWSVRHRLYNCFW